MVVMGSPAHARDTRRRWPHLLAPCLPLLLAASAPPPARADVYDELYAHIERGHSAPGGRASEAPVGPVATTAVETAHPDSTDYAPQLGQGGATEEAWAPYMGYIVEASDIYRVPAGLIHAVVAVESRFDPSARSKRGAVGLMQLMPATAGMLGVHDRLDPRQNVLAGTRYLRRLLDRFAGDVILAVAAYNAGPTAVRRHDGVPPFAETQRYVSRVLAGYGEAQALYDRDRDRPVAPVAATGATR